MTRKARRMNHGDRTPSSSRSSRAAAAIEQVPPRVSPIRVSATNGVLVIIAVGLLAADSWMTWLGFAPLPVDWWVKMALTSLVIAVQLGSGLVQALGGNPLVGLGGTTDADQVLGWFIRGLYFMDFFSNFNGFGGSKHLTVTALMFDPLGNLGWIIWYAGWSVGLVFGDEIVLRLCDRTQIGARANQQRAKLFDIQTQAHNTVLETYRRRAIRQAEKIGNQLDVDFEWLEDDDDV